MAPEQAAGDPDIDHRADIYAFGCMAYELLAGQPPFHGRTPARILAAHMGEAPRPIAELRPDAPRGAERSRDALPGEGCRARARRTRPRSSSRSMA